MNNQIKEAKKRFKPTDTTYCSPVLNVFTCENVVRVSKVVTDKIKAFKGDYVTIKTIKGKLYLVKSTKEEGCELPTHGIADRLGFLLHRFNYC